MDVRKKPKLGDYRIRSYEGVLGGTAWCVEAYSRTWLGLAKGWLPMNVLPLKSEEAARKRLAELSVNPGRVIDG